MKTAVIIILILLGTFLFCYFTDDECLGWCDLGQVNYYIEWEKPWGIQTPQVCETCGDTIWNPLSCHATLPKRNNNELFAMEQITITSNSTTDTVYIQDPNVVVIWDTLGICPPEDCYDDSTATEKIYRDLVRNDWRKDTIRNMRNER